LGCFKKWEVLSFWELFFQSKNGKFRVMGNYFFNQKMESFELWGIFFNQKMESLSCGEFFSIKKWKV
jgi:hypothetical protein